MLEPSASLIISSISETEYPVYGVPRLICGHKVMIIMSLHPHCLQTAPRVDTDQEPRNHAFLIPHFPGRLSLLDSSTLGREQEQHPDQLRDGQELIFSAEFLK